MTDPAAGLTHVHSGKVRDLYRTADGALIMVASDRISAFDHILDNPIPDKGRILTAMSVWWFEQLAGVVRNHVVGVDDPAIPPAWRGCALLCTPLEMIPVEAVARGYLTGSGLLDYRATGAVCGVSLPPGLVDGDRLPEPIFTPASKAELGEHDENVSYEVVAATVGTQVAAALRDLTLRIYGVAAGIAAERGIILADTKFEFGLTDAGDLLLIDEMMTPDSSRYWPRDEYAPGGPQPSFDKQFVRDYLEAIRWNKQPPVPSLPDEVVARTREKYLDAYRRLTGEALEPAGA